MGASTSQSGNTHARAHRQHTGRLDHEAGFSFVCTGVLSEHAHARSACSGVDMHTTMLQQGAGFFLEGSSNVSSSRWFYSQTARHQAVHLHPLGSLV
jgi:hypothetical protein